MQMQTIIRASVVLTIIFLAAAIFVMWGDRFMPASSDEPQSVNVLPLGEGPNASHLTVRESGIVAVTRAELRAINHASADQSFTAETIMITNYDQPVPFYATDETIYFYGQAVTDTLTAPSVYTLSLPQDGEQGVVMANRSAQPTTTGVNTGRQTIRLEQNQYFLPQATNDDVWLGDLIWAPDSLELDLGTLQPAAEQTGRVTIRVWSNNETDADPDHHLRVLLNDELIADEWWDGITSYTIESDISVDLLREGANKLTIEAPGDTGAAEAIYLDWVELETVNQLTLNTEQLTFSSQEPTITVAGTTDEALVFDVTNLTEPQIITDVRYDEASLSFTNDAIGGDYIVMRPSHAIKSVVNLIPEWETVLKSAEQGADYIAIYPNDPLFESALTPLLAYRTQTGLTTLGVNADQIYTEFAGGQRTPEALRDFIMYTIDNWSPAPRFVLLIGDASYDQYDLTAGTNRNLLPTHLVNTEYAGLVASDTWFTTTDESLAPRVALGRMTAQTPEQLSIIIEKTLEYEQAEPSRWHRRTLLVSDDDQDEFDLASDQLDEALLAGGFENQKLYMSENEDINDAIVGAINYGVGILNYVGHGSMRVWGDERVFRVEDVPKLENVNQYPIFTTFTCLNGYFNHPDDNALTEVLLWQEDGGIVAGVAPSGRSLTRQQAPLANAFFDSLLNGEATTLGEALQIAKTTGSQDPFLAEVIHTFNLFGDPALELKMP